LSLWEWILSSSVSPCRFFGPLQFDKAASSFIIEEVNISLFLH
jgi:hypothetical protein